MDGADTRGGPVPAEPSGGDATDASPIGPAPSDPVAVPPAERRWWRLRVSTWREILLFLLLLFCYGSFQQQPSWNEFSRYDLVRALVQDGTTRIDPYESNTGDKALYDGHYYSDKAPGTALIGIPAYALLAFTSAVVGRGTPASETAIAALAFVECGLFTALLSVLLLRFLRPAVGDAWALTVALGYGLGSIAFPFATMFFGHAASAFFLFAAFYLLWTARGDPRPWRPLVAGLLAGCAVIVEMPVVLGVAVLAVYALWVRRRSVVLFVLGGIPLALVLATYDWLTFGGPFEIGYQYATLFGQQNAQGIVSIVWPSPAAAVDLIAGPRGLLRLAPWFALAPLGILAWRRRGQRAEIAVAVAMCCVFLLYNSGALNPFGGWTPGPRYLVPALPFAAILVGLAPMRVRPLVAVLIAVSVVLVAIATITMPNAPEAYGDPMRDLWLPRLFSGDLALTRGWLDWGLPTAASAAVLLVGAALGGIGLLATFGKDRSGRIVVGASAAGLLAFTLLFATPFIPWAALPVSALSATGDGVSLVSTGVTPVVNQEKPGASIWALLRNDGPRLTRTKVEFGVNGWSAWSTNVDWAQHDRKRVGVVWDTSTVQPGDYAYWVKVVDQDDATKVYLEVPEAGVVHVGH